MKMSEYSSGYFPKRPQQTIYTQFVEKIDITLTIYDKAQNVYKSSYFILDVSMYKHEIYKYVCMSLCVGYVSLHNLWTLFAPAKN